MFGEMMHDLSAHDFLAIRVRLRGSQRLRNSYFVNIQTDGYITTDLWQHRLYFQRDDGEWEDVFVGSLVFSSFYSSDSTIQDSATFFCSYKLW